MGLETGSYISNLVSSNPTGADRKLQGDDHLRLIKSVLQNSFAGLTGAVIVSGTNGGAVNAYTLTPTPPLVSYVVNMTIIFTPTATNTGAVTVNVSALGAISLKAVDGSALIAGDIQANQTYTAKYNGTDFRLEAVTKNYIDQLAFGTALPTQAGNADKFVTTNGSTASWASNLKSATIRWADSTDVTKLLAFDISGYTTGTTRTATWPNKSGTIAMTTDVGLPPPLAALTPSAVANLDFLNTFGSSYDFYLIIGQGLKPSATTTLAVQMGNAGSADSGSNYFTDGALESASQYSTSATSFVLTNTVLNTGKGADFNLLIGNANDAANNVKKLTVFGVSEIAAGNYFNRGRTGVYIAANAISGIRLFWTSGANFAATGKVYIYGFRNS